MLVEHNPGEGVISVYAPDDAEPRLEFDALADIPLPDLSGVRELFLETDYNPADPESYNHILRKVAASFSVPPVPMNR